jgi:hypothetical protein
MPKFTRLEVWSDVACNSGTRLAVYPQGTLLSCQATFSIDGNEQLTFSVPARRIVAIFEELRLTEDDGTRITEDSFTRITESSASSVAQDTYLIRGLVVRVCTDSATAFDEWRITDIEDESGSTIIGVRCLPIALDLARALYVSYDSTGAPVTAFDAVEIDAEGIVDGPIRDALDAANLPYIVKGTIQPTGTFDVSTDWDSAQGLALAAIQRGGGELQVRRNGTTDYKIDILNEIGSTAPVVTARTARNLLSNKRTRSGSLGGTRVVARGRDDSTSRTIGYAYWEVVSVDTASTPEQVVIRDPRGAGFPSPVPFTGMLDGAYVSRLVPTYAGHLILGSYEDSVAGQAVIEVTDASTFAASDRVEFRETNAVNGERLWGLTDPAQVATYGGVYDRILDRPTLSGVVNYAPNPFVRDFTQTLTYGQDTATLSGITSSTASPDVTFPGVNATRVVTVGDTLLRASDDALIGVVQSVAADATLTANAALTLSGVPFKVQRLAPAGARVGTTGAFTWSQGSSLAAGGAAQSWDIVQEASVGSNSYFELPVMTPYVAAPTDYQFGVWCEVADIDTGASITFSLRRADTGAAIPGANVVLDPSNLGQLVRVLFVGPNVSTSTGGVVIRMAINWAGGRAVNVKLGPWFMQPAAWVPTDTEAPRACDLWHEATIWLRDQVVPVGYALDIADLEQIDGTQFPYDGIALGGTIRIDDRDLGIVTDQRVVAFTRDYLRPGDVSLTLGRRDKTLAEYLAETSGQSSVSDIALQLSRGLFAVARQAAAQSVAEATPSGVTTVDTAAIFTIGESLRESFTEG